MTERGLLGDMALGDLAAILPAVALADATGPAIRPDPDARPHPPPDREHQVERPVRAPPRADWRPSAISVSVTAPNDGLDGYAELGTGVRRLSPGVVRVAKGTSVTMSVFYHVDAVGMPRTEQPVRPPQVGLQWYYTPDGGARGETSVNWDPAPEYRGDGRPLSTNFSPYVVFVPAASGWLTLSARIDDVAGAAEFDDTIRVLVSG